MADGFEIEPQGYHEYLVRLHSEPRDAESWFRITPSLLEQLGAAEQEEESVVRRTVEFLIRHHDVEDFPQVVELEDVIASYGDDIGAMTR